MWLYLGRGGDAATLEQDPGIPPPEYAYLDNGRVVVYLGQIEGGMSSSEKRTRSVKDTRTGGVAVGGVELGGSSASDQAVEETVTPTATSLFYRLLDRLGDKGYLRELDASSSPNAFARALAVVPEGFFVRIAGCRIRVPTYIQMREIIADSGNTITADKAWLTALDGTEEERIAAQVAEQSGKSGPQIMVGEGTYRLTDKQESQLKLASKRYVRAIAANPPVPLASCAGKLLATPRKPDLLFPVLLDGLTKERSLLAGPVTIVGKVVRQVRRPADVYVDRGASAAYANAVADMDGQLADVGFDVQGGVLSDELSADVTVFPPGAIILPIAIYK